MALFLVEKGSAYELKMHEMLLFLDFLFIYKEKQIGKFVLHKS